MKNANTGNNTTVETNIRKHKKNQTDLAHRIVPEDKNTRVCVNKRKGKSKARAHKSGEKIPRDYLNSA